MKKFLTTFLALMLVFSTSIAFTGCKKNDGKTKIGFSSGNYNCSLNQDSFELNENLTDAEIEQYLEFSSEDEEYTAFDDFVEDLPDLFANTYFKINTYSIEMYNYEISDTLFVEASIKFDKYKFKNNILSFNDEAGGNYKITKNEDNTLTLRLEESYDFGSFEAEEYKLIYTLDVVLTLESEINPITFPTPETDLYEDKTIKKSYKLTSFSDLDAYYAEYSDLFALVGINGVEAFNNYLTKNSKATLILFNDFTLYYEANVDLGSIFDSLMEDYDIGLEINTRLGYIYSYQQSSQENEYAVMDNLNKMFDLKILNNGANINITVEDFLTETSYVLNFTEVTVQQ